MKRLLKMCLGCIALACIITAYLCKKDGSKQPSKLKSIDSTELRLSAGVWVLHLVEYPKTATTWAVAYDSFNFSTLTLHSDHTLEFADNNTVTNTGTWKLSKDVKLLSLTYAGQTEVDTLGAVSATTLQLTIPKQISVNINFYEYYRDTYVLRK
jgi:hypothetical protein